MVDVHALSPAEQQVWEAFPTGGWVNLGTGNDADDDPVHGVAWGEARQVKAEVLLALLCGQVDVPAGQVGMVSLRGARITGEIYLPGAKFKHPLRLEKCYVGDGLNLQDATIPTLHLDDCHIGPINLKRTKVDGVLSLRGAHLDGGDKPAMEAEGLTVTGNVRCDSGFRAEGTVSMPCASIAGRLMFTGADLDGKGGAALYADLITVIEGMFCNQDPVAPWPRLQGDKFRTHGGIRLRGANVGHLALNGASLSGTPGKDGKVGYALDADQLSVTGVMSCTGRFYANGLISLRGASLKQLDFRDARLECVKKPDHGMVANRPSKGPATTTSSGATRSLADGPELPWFMESARRTSSGMGDVLNAQDLTVTYEMLWNGVSADGVVSLAGAKIGRLVDDEPSWPKHIILIGLTYGDLGNPDISVKDRLDWLNRTPPIYPYSPQPYQQLAAFYRGLGHDDSARRVLLESQRLRTQQLISPPSSGRRRRWGWWLWGRVQDVLAGYGYLPGRALLWLAVAFVAGLLVFRGHPPAPADPTAHAAFNAWVYTSDTLIPTQVFGQLSDWDPHGITLVVTLVLRIFGWVLAITVAAAIGRSFTRS